MRRRPVVLAAVSPAALAAVRTLLGDQFELVVVHSLDRALNRLARGRIDLILAGLHFDDSLLPALLEAVKRDPSIRDVPVVCGRFLPTVLKPASVRTASEVSRLLGAEAFIDVWELEQREGRRAAAQSLRNALLGTLRRTQSDCDA